MKKTVNQIKQEQGFNKKAPMCNNCKYFTYDEVRGTHFYDEHHVYQKNLRCSIAPELLEALQKTNDLLKDLDNTHTGDSRYADFAIQYSENRKLIEKALGI